MDVNDTTAGKKSNPVAVIFFTVFMDMLGFGILLPVIPILFADPSSPFYMLPSGTPIGYGLILLGLLVGIYPFMIFLSAPILGQLSDKYGRKRLLAVSLAGTALAHFLFAIGIITNSIPLLFLSRAFDGITGGNISIAQASLADVTPPRDRAKTFGLIGAAFGLGFILGPFIGGILADRHIVSWFNASTPFFFAAFLSAVNVSLLLLRLPETLLHPKAHPINWLKSIRNFTKAYSLKRMRMLFFSIFLFTAGFTFFTSFFNVFLIEKFSFDESGIGAFFAYVGLWVALTQLIITRRLSGRFSSQQILKITFFGTGVLMLFYFLMTSWWQLLLIAPFVSICIGLTIANSTALVSSSVDAESQGEILGINASVTALAQTIPPFLSGFIAASIFPSAPILVSGLVILAAAVVFITFYKPVEKEHVQLS